MMEGLLGYKSRIYSINGGKITDLKHQITNKPCKKSVLKIEILLLDIVWDLEFRICGKKWKSFLSTG